MEINKIKVIISMFIPFLLVFTVIFVGLYLNDPPEYFLSSFIDVFVSTSPLWGAMIVVCLILQLAMIKSTSGKDQLVKLLIIETLVATALSLHFFIGILIVGGIGNILRYQWLVYKGRMYKKV